MRKEIKIRANRLVYDDKGEGRVIVFVHGQPFNRSMWQYQQGLAGEGYRLIIPDLRGYGESGIPEKITLLDEIALDIIDLLEVLHIKKAIFAGLSMGGQILFDLYRLAPQLFEGMVVCDTTARPETEQSYTERLDLCRKMLGEGMKQYTQEVIHDFLHPHTFTTRPDVVAHLTQMMETTSPVGAAAVQRGRAERKDHLPVLGSISCPALVVVGRDDVFTPVSLATEMQEHIPQSMLAVIDNASHMPNMEQPEVFNRHLLHFLKSLD